MDLIEKNILKYCESFTSAESDLLYRLNRQTHLRINNPRMLSGHLQGRFLSLISKLVRPIYILEIGTYTGYSALCLAEGLQDGGKLITIDSNEETNLFVRNFLSQSPISKKIELLEGNAMKLIPDLNLTFDLIFIDADKSNYASYFDLVIDKVRSGGIIIADNVLWSGKVLHAVMDADTQALHEFNTKVAADPRVESTLLPVRDGLMLLRKI